MDAASALKPKIVSKLSGISRKKGKIFLWFLAIFVIVIGVFVYWKFFYNYGDGYRTGLLQKFSHKGNFYKTYEGQMILNAMPQSNIILGYEKFDFSVLDKSLAQKLDTMQGRMIIVHYRQKNGALFWEGDSEYMVDSVRPQK